MTNLCWHFWGGILNKCNLIVFPFNLKIKKKGFSSPYLSSVGSVGPTVRHAGMWGVPIPGGRSLVCSGSQPWRHSWTLLGIAGQTGARRSPRGRGPNSSPLQNRVDKWIWIVPRWLVFVVFFFKWYNCRCSGGVGGWGRKKTSATRTLILDSF